MLYDDLSPQFHNKTKKATLEPLGTLLRLPRSSKRSSAKLRPRRQCMQDVAALLVSVPFPEALYQGFPSWTPKPAPIEGPRTYGNSGPIHIGGTFQEYDPLNICLDQERCSGRCPQNNISQKPNRKSRCP